MPPPRFLGTAGAGWRWDTRLRARVRRFPRASPRRGSRPQRSCSAATAREALGCSPRAASRTVNLRPARGLVRPARRDGFEDAAPFQRGHCAAHDRRKPFRLEEAAQSRGGLSDATNLGKARQRHTLSHPSVHRLAPHVKEPPRLGRAEPERRHDEDQLPDAAARVDPPVRGQDRSRLQAPRAARGSVWQTITAIARVYCNKLQCNLGATRPYSHSTVAGGLEVMS